MKSVCVMGEDEAEVVGVENDDGATSYSESLGIDDILNVDDEEIQRLDVPEWGGHVFVRVLTGRERAQFVAKSRQEKNPANLTPYLVSLMLCDEHGERIVRTEGQTKALAGKSGVVLERIADAGLRLNGMTDDAVEEIEGN